MVPLAVTVAAVVEHGYPHENRDGDESASPRRSSPHSAPNFFVHIDAHDTHVSARGREAWRLRTVSSKIAPIVRAAAALAGTASAGHGIAQRRRYVSQHASVESAAL